MERKAEAGESHDENLRRFDDFENERFVVAVGELTGNAGEQYVRKNEESAGQVRQQLRIDRGVARRLIGGQNHERILIYVVVESAERLGAEEGEKTSFREKPKLTAIAHAKRPCRPVRKI